MAGKSRLLLILVLTTFSCTQRLDKDNTISSQNLISFDAPILQASSTKSSEALSETVDLRVFAKYYPSTFTSWDAGTDYFTENGATVSYAANIYGNLGGWHSATKYYWPKKGSLSFQVYAPATIPDGNTLTSSIAPNPIISQTGVNAELTLNPARDSQIDFLYSERIINQKNNSVSENFYGVQIPFHHALAKISFHSMLRSSLNEGVTMKITNIELQNVYLSGTFTQTLTANSHNEKTSVSPIESWTPWAISGSLGNYANVVCPSPSNLSTKISGEDYSEIYIIPQSIDPTTQIIVTYHTITADPYSDITTTATIDYDKFIEKGISSFDIAKHYIFNLLLGKDKKIYFDPQMKNWENQDLSGDIHYEF